MEIIITEGGNIRAADTYRGYSPVKHVVQLTTKRKLWVCDYGTVGVEGEGKLVWDKENGQLYTERRGNVVACKIVKTY